MVVGGASDEEASGEICFLLTPIKSTFELSKQRVVCFSFGGGGIVPRCSKVGSPYRRHKLRAEQKTNYEIEFRRNPLNLPH